MEMISKSFFYLYNLKDEMVFIQVKKLNRRVLFNALYCGFFKWSCVWSLFLISIYIWSEVISGTPPLRSSFFYRCDHLINLFGALKVKYF